MMETTTTLAIPRPRSKHSRFSKALPAPPPDLIMPAPTQLAQLPARKDSLATGPARTIAPLQTFAPSPVSLPSSAMSPSTPSSAMTSRTVTALPSLPYQNDTSTPMSASMAPIKRKAVGAGAISPPTTENNAQSYRIPSPTDSIGSLLSEYSKDRGDFSDKRSSSETVDTKESSNVSSPPRKAGVDPIRINSNMDTRPQPVAAVAPISSAAPAPAIHEVYIPPVSSSLWRKKSRDKVEFQEKKQEQQHALPALPPPPPIKDETRPVTPQNKAAAASATANALASLPPVPTSSDYSPSDSSLLKRRSVKAEKPLALPELHLAKSNGHTTTPMSAMPLSSRTPITPLGQIPARKPLNELPNLPISAAVAPTPSSTAPTPPSKQVSPPAGLPGRNVRPSANTPSPPAVPAEKPRDQPALRPKKSLVRMKAEELDRQHNESQMQAQRSSPMSPGFSSATRRPPTPEYTKEESQALAEPVVLSPAPPVSPAPEEAPAPAFEAPTQRSQPSNATSIPPRRPGASLHHVAEPAPLKTVKSLGNLRSATPSPPPQQALPPMPKSGTPSLLQNQARVGLPRSPAPMRSVDNLRNAQSPSPNALPTRRSSRQLPPSPPSGSAAASPVNGSVPLAWTPSPLATPAPLSKDIPRRPMSPVREQSVSSIKPITHDTRVVEDPEEMAIPARGDVNYFPIIKVTYARGSILAAPPLKASHYDCFQNHAHMLPNKNEHYPLACQTCNKADKELRWTCNFCHLRVCRPCHRGLGLRNKSLARLMGDLQVGGGMLEEEREEQRRMEEQRFEMEQRRKQQQQMEGTDPVIDAAPQIAVRAAA